MYKAFLYNSYIIKKKYYNLAKVFLYIYIMNMQRRKQKVRISYRVIAKKKKVKQNT